MLYTLAILILQNDSQIRFHILGTHSSAAEPRELECESFKSNPLMTVMTSHSWEESNCHLVSASFLVRRRREGHSRHGEGQFSMESSGGFWKKASTGTGVCRDQWWKLLQWGLTLASLGSRAEGPDPHSGDNMAWHRCLSRR